MGIFNAIFGKKEQISIDTKVETAEKPAEKLVKLDDTAVNGVIKDLPWHGNGIYLEDKNKQVKAVCSNPEISKVLAECMECYTSLKAFEGSKTKAYGQFIQDAYYLYIALSAAKIPVTSIETAFVEKAFHKFCLSLKEIVSREHLTFENLGVNSEQTITEKENKDGLESLQQKR